MRQHHRKTLPLVTKKQDTYKDKMKYSNNYNICIKCYINLCYIVPDETGSLNTLADANTNFKQDFIKKIIKKITYFH